jgi:flagellar hook assembly protein FlgD
VYPNPFTNETKIKFTLNKTDEIALMVYDTNGKLVRALINNNQMTEGEYQIMWDGKNSGGIDLPNGTYIYKLSGSSFKETSGKMVLTK